MTDEEKGAAAANTDAGVITKKPTSAVVRSRGLPVGVAYPEYRQYLRRDFWYACAYCTMTESEAEAIRFTIDHYEPQSVKPELKDVYENLMYACDECNKRKGSLCPSEEMRREGKRFFRADQDVRGEHFELEGGKVKGKTKVGSYTTLAVDLNRRALVRLRELRQRLIDDDGYVSEGMRALASFAIDRLSPETRTKALAAIKKGLEQAGKVYNDMDEALLELSKSEMLMDEKTDEDKRANQERLAQLRQMDGLYPRAWRGRKTSKKRR
jgi:hypothetical protein